MKNSKSSIFGGLFWSFGERIIAQLVTTIVTIVLARILDPTHYGIISIVTVFITFCNIFVSGGFGSAVVQKKDAIEEDFNVAFAISLSVSIILYIIIFISAPFIADFYHMSELTWVMRVMGIRLIFASLNTIQHAYIQKKMQFKKFFFATLFGTVISAFIGIFLALHNFGVWALVAQYLSNTIIDSIVLLFVGGWKPKIQFKKEVAKKLFSFGWKVLVTEFIYTLANDIRSLIVGKCFGSKDLAFFDQGKRYPALFVNNINSAINKVMLPTYSSKQEKINELKFILRKSVRLGIFILSPILIGFAVISENVVLLMLTEKWLPCVPFIQIFCISFLTRPLETSCHQALLAIGDSGIVLKIILSINVVSLLLIFIIIFTIKSVLLVAICSLISAFVSFLLFMIMSCKKIGYMPREQIKDIIPSLLLGITMGGIVFLIGKIQLPTLIVLIIQIISGIIIYVLLSKVFKVNAYIYLIEKVKGIFKKNNKVINEQ